MNGPKIGNFNPVLSVATVSADLITKGDMLWQDSGNSNAPRPASAYTWDTNLLTTQTSFKLLYLGIALDDKPVGSTAAIRIATDGVFDMTFASGTLAQGALVGPAKASGNALENQKVAVAVVAGAIGRVTKANVSAATKARIRHKATLVVGAQT